MGKMRRAVADLKALERDTGKFLWESNPYVVTIEFDPDSGWHTAYSRVLKKPPPDLGVLVGSIAYQLISSLNVIVWALASRKRGRERVEKFRFDVAFPIAEDPAAFKRKGLIAGRHISKKAVAILEGLQPYSRPNWTKRPNQHPFVWIKELADSDKHRVVAPRFGTLDFRGVEFEWDRRVASSPIYEPCVAPRWRWAYEDGTPIARIRFLVGNEDTDVYVDPQPEPDVLFASEHWLLGADDLRNAVMEAHHALSELAVLFPQSIFAQVPHPR